MRRPAVGSHDRPRHVRAGGEQRLRASPTRDRPRSPRRPPCRTSVRFSTATRIRRSLMNSPSRYSPSSRNARRSGGWNTFSAASVSPVVLGLARTRWTDASLPLLMGRMTFSMSPSSKKCSNALSCNGYLLIDVANGYERHVLRSRGAGAEVRVRRRLRGNGGTRRQRDVEHRDRSHTSSLLPSLRGAGARRAPVPSRIGARSGRGKRCQTRCVWSARGEGHGRSSRARRVVNRCRSGWDVVPGCGQWGTIDEVRSANGAGDPIRERAVAQ